MSPIPLVRLDIIENHWSADRPTVRADIVQDVMIDEFAAPKRDRYQIHHRTGSHHRTETSEAFMVCGVVISYASITSP